MGKAAQPKLDTIAQNRIISREGTFVTQVAAGRLARICAYSGRAPEWEQLVRLVTPVAALSARRVSAIWGDNSSQSMNEIVQEVFLKLCENERKILREFEDRGNDSFFKFIRMISASVATDHFRRLQAEKRGGREALVAPGPAITAESFADPQATEAILQPLLIGQLDGLLRCYPESVSARDRNLFWLHYRHGMTAKDISRIPAIGLSAKGVESALLRLTRVLRDRIDSGKLRPIQTALRVNKVRKAKGISGVIAIDSVKER
jgi:RNA polymerase sigma-70 factor, ECF subfamily